MNDDLTKTCRGCRFWKVFDADITEGSCLRYPPVPVPYPVPDGRGNMGIMSMCPVTKGSMDACGEYQKKTLPVVSA